MRTKTITLVLIFVVAISVCTFGESLSLGKTIVSVTLNRSEQISDRTLDKAYEDIVRVAQLAGKNPASIQKNDVLKTLIDDVLLRLAAEKKGIKVQSDDITKIVQSQKKSLELSLGRQLTDKQFEDYITKQSNQPYSQYLKDVETQYLRQAYIVQEKKDIIQSAKVPTQEEIEEVYEMSKTSFINPDLVKVSHIFFSTLNESEADKKNTYKLAQDVLSKLKNTNASFEDLALQYSDDAKSKLRGGDLGYVPRTKEVQTQIESQYGRAFYQAIFNTPKGSYSDIVQSNEGYHILKVTDKQSAKILSIDDPVSPGNNVTVRMYIRNMLYQNAQNEAMDRAYREAIKDLWKQADIVAKDKAYEPVIEELKKKMGI